ncbi:hypothetical protein GH714_028938 [Hevea brasiliensis]|uniref:Uncharacterized protein n=1 Tax=Hevea brasiliensis TaxID=3981 RepID=A0A6A6LUT5_HEVBR|nr:hypothetical protein GH714_028938 [Hevea brasiliensis]
MRRAPAAARTTASGDRRQGFWGDEAPEMFGRLARSAVAMDVYSTMKILDDLDFKSWMDWKIIMELVLDPLPEDKFVNVKTLCDDREEEWGLDELICRCEKESVCHMLKSNRTVSGEREGMGNDQLGEKPKEEGTINFILLEGQDT